jgi:hypothetical protein
MFQAQASEQRTDPVAIDRSASKMLGQGKIVADIQRSDKVWLLKHDADPAAAKTIHFRLREGIDNRIIDDDLSGHRRAQTCKHLK